MRARRTWRRALVVVVAMAALASCFEEEAPASDGGTDGGVVGPAEPRADYQSTALWAAPWPDERLRGPDGRVDVSGFATRRNNLAIALTRILQGAPGFGVSSSVYFPLEGPVDPSSLPSPHESLSPDASVFLLDVDPESPERGRRVPIVAGFEPDLGPFGARNVLALLPLQGRPLSANRLYAAVVTTRVRGVDGAPMRVAPAFEALLGGERPAGMSEPAFAAHRTALDALRTLGVPTSEVAVTAVFRTWDPVADLVSARAQVLAGPLPPLEAPFALSEVFDEYCVFHTTVRMPVFQEGEAPYLVEGGRWARDESGRLVQQREDRANAWVTVPRRAMPDGGFPSAVFIRTGGGGDRPLVDRGPHSEPGAGAPPGSGPALHFARAGFVGVSVDGPLGGLRNLDDWDEQFAIFNINNPEGLRDTIRQSALELALLAHLLPALSIEADGCPGVVTPAGVVSLDTSRLAIMGHSMGATIAPLAVAVEPAYRAMILSGAGASWIENVLHKRSPLHVRPIAEALLGYIDHPLTAHDPVLTLLQWGGETADPQVYAPSIGPRHVLMFQGILDTYIPPPVANALSLALGLDLGGEGLDETLPQYEPLGRFLDLAGGARVPLPVAGNRAEGRVTAVVVQHPEDGIEDGHEVVYQTPSPQLQYRCFLEALVDGLPHVPRSDGSGCN